MTNSSSSAATTPQVAPENGEREIRLLKSTDDDYCGVVVEMDEPMDSATFVPILRASISHWRLLVVFHISCMLLLIDEPMDSASFFKLCTVFGL